MNENDDIGRDDDAIARLMQLAGPRAEPPAERHERVMANVKAHWRKRLAQETAPPPRRTWQWLPAAAAALLVAVGVLRFGPWQVEPASDLALVASIAGEVDIERGERAFAGDAAQRLAPGDRVRTGADGGMILIAASGHEVRVDRASAFELRGADRIALMAGAVYVDSRDGASTGSLHVTTPFGVARDVGTRFAVRVDDDGLEVIVRDGEVRVRDAAVGAEWSAHAGEGLRRPSRATEVTRFDVVAWDPRWDWARDLVAFEVNGAPTHDYLAWLSREYGWTLRYADEQARARALEPGFGVVDGLTVEETLDAVMRTAELAWQVDEGELIVTVAGER